MQEKEKLEQPKLVETEEENFRFCEAPQPAVDSEKTSTISTAANNNSPQPVHICEEPSKIVSAYGDLEEVSPDKSNIDSKDIYQGRKEILMVDRILAYIIDTCIVSTISTLFFMAIMSILIFNGGDFVSNSLSDLQREMTGNMWQAFSIVWSITTFSCVAPFLGFITFILLFRDFSAASLMAEFFVALGPIARLVYQAAYIAGKRQATVGMMFCGIKVQRIDGGRLSLGQSILRELIIFVEYLTFQILTFLPVIFSLNSEDHRMHDKITGTVLAPRKYGLSKHEIAELLPFGLAIGSVAISFVVGNFYEATLGQATDLKQLEFFRAVYGENSENYLRHRWRYTAKRAKAGDFNKNLTNEKDLQSLISFIQNISARWGENDDKVLVLTRTVIQNTPANRFLKEREILLNMALRQSPEHSDTKSFAPNGELALLYLDRAKSLSYDQSFELYRKIYALGKSKLHSGTEDFKLRAAFMCAADALGHEEEIREQMYAYDSRSYKIDDIDELHWSYWDYRLFQLMLAEYMQTKPGFRTADIIKELTDWEQQPGHEARLKTPRAKPDPIEERTIERLSQSYPTLMVQLKPSYWKYGGSP